MKVDKEGFSIVINTAIIALLIVIIAYFSCSSTATIIIGSVMLLIVLFVIRFFRLPKRAHLTDDNALFSPADGTIVALEKTIEGEYFKDQRIQVSIFMSIWNVHANWYPIKGTVCYFRHHQGDFLVANHPKSSTQNERTTTVIESGSVKVLFRQVAGYVARRIVSYAKEGNCIEQNSRCGFIKFGSRIDIFLPLDTNINVSLGDKVVGTQTIIATFRENSSK